MQTVIQLLAAPADIERADLPDWLGALTFVSKTDRVALQAADCLAAGALFHERLEHPAAPPEISASSLVMTGGKPATIDAPVSVRLPITRAIIGDLRDELLLTKAQRTLRRSIVGGQ